MPFDKTQTEKALRELVPRDATAFRGTRGRDFGNRGPTPETEAEREPSDAERAHGGGLPLGGGKR